MYLDTRKKIKQCKILCDTSKGDCAHSFCAKSMTKMLFEVTGS